MRGWRARIGVIYPADGLIDEEYWRLAPNGVSILMTRIGVPDEPVSVAMATKVGETEEIEQAAKCLKIVRPNVIVYACTSGSFVKGTGWDLEIADRIEKASGVKATTTSTAIVEAMKTLKIRKVAVAAPYPDDVNETLAGFLKQNGFKVVNVKGLGLRSAWDIGNTPPSRVYQHAKSATTPDADGVLIPCTGFPTIDILEALEEDLGKPVVSANQATIWKAGAMAGIGEQMSGLGSLMRKRPIR
jgi:maleate isomerase